MARINPDEIRESLQREPFEPVRLKLTRGDAYDIRDPNVVAPGQRRLFIAYTDADRWAACAYLHADAVEAIADGNSRRRKRRREVGRTIHTPT